MPERGYRGARLGTRELTIAERRSADQRKGVLRKEKTEKMDTWDGGKSAGAGELRSPS
jgi:hypothetical protein